MRSAPVSHPVLRAVVLVCIASGAVLVACSPRIAGNLTGPAPAAASTSPSDVAVADSAAETASPQSKPYFDFQVNKPATMRPGTRGPTYPPELRAAGVQGAVLAQFVVNADGTVDSTSIRILKSDHPGLVDAVRGALPAMTFLPAEVSNGTKVRQLLQMPFQFKLDTPGAFVSPGGATVPSPAAGTSPRNANMQSGGAQPPSGARASVSAPNDNSLPYFDFQTTKPAVILAGSVGPEYPPELRSTGVEGGVLAQFVVDETGRPLVSTFKALRSDHALFSDAVKQALERLRFTPAEVKGKQVKQLVQQPFQFSLSR